MIKYTLKQMLEKLERNHSLKFEYLGDEDHGIENGAVIHLTEDGYVVDNFGHSILSCFNLGSRFRLVNEPVDRMTAFRAFYEGKSICCEYKDTRRCYKPKEKLMLEDNDRFAISVLEILYGKWFIREGEQ
ncbi:MAG: hypothetical protein LKE46_01655 [Clostridium sp.]|jgi:hypothetical protein|uniref:hypothetical protein n=1 Tax=Clostridium sp. TaxID=1506 RepID=UPI0025C1661C|nr:hypothetical protein [Clostridium sp.]MCH3962955.1 hypothetical protein [Clostridium sp.]MCI1800164.1 hypothetical protein [Clostridium sp.]MCI2200159.1 hypothetical protein [Clostridium sp.]